MYLADLNKHLGATKTKDLNLLRSKGGRNVMILGLVSMFTDISSEMVVAVIPLFLTSQVGFGIFSFAIFEGIFQTAGAFFRLWGGQIADRTSNAKRTAAFGYAVSTVTRLGLFLSTFIGQVFAIPFLIADRVGKGIRVAPRDSLISRSVPKEKLATAFGIHRSLDTMGALLGPIAAWVILGLTPNAFDSVFFVSLMAGGVGVAIIIWFAKNPEELDETPVPIEEPKPVEKQIAGVPQLIKAVAQNNAYYLVGAAGLLSLFTIGESLLYLYLFREGNLDATLFPLLYAGTAIVHLLLAVPVGKLGDTYGKVKVFLAGQALLIPAYLLIANVEISGTIVLLTLAIFGVYFASTDGVLAAIASAIAPEESRGTLLGAVSMTVALARLVSAISFGFLWGRTSLGAQNSVNLYVVALVIALIISSVFLRKLPINKEDQSYV